MWVKRGAVNVVLAFVFLSVSGFTVTTSAEKTEVVRQTLGNGLRVIIVRNTLAPVVTTAVNYLVGANETPPGFPGTAHAQEHMLFRGSPDLSADQLADIGSLVGGDFNADTRQTVTQYFFTVSAQNLDAALHIEALRMRGILDTAKDWDQERGAIEQEVAQDLSDPVYVLYTKLRLALFSGTPYAHDALGTRPSFDKTTAAMLKAFYDKWYAPNNAILIIVGDVDPHATLDKVQQLFGPIAPKQLPDRPEVKLEPVTPQSFSLDTDLSYGLQVIALRMPGLDSPDFPAAEVLADVLRSQRGELYGLVPQGKALGADFAYEPLPQAGLAYAVTTFPSGSDPKALESDMRAILAKIAKNGVPADLVAAAKVQERRGAEFQKNSISELATVWSEAVAVYGLDSPDEDLARIEKVTVEDVNRVARKYLDLDRTITAVLTPQSSGKPVASHGFGGQENISLGQSKPTPLPGWAQSALTRVSVPVSTVHPFVSTLPNGITLIVQPEDVSDTVSVFGHVRNRPELQVPKGQEGLSQVLEALFPYGTERLDRIAFQEALDAIGADEHAGTDFSVQILAENFERGVELLADNELHPRLPEHAFDIVRRQVAETVAGNLTSPNYLSGRALRAALFPKDDPTLREALPQTVSGLTLQDVRNFYQSAFRPDLTAILVIGKVSPQQARSVIEKYFGGWSALGPKPDIELPPVPLNTQVTSQVPDASRVQDSVILAETLKLTRSNPDYYALQLGNNVLGGGFYASRLTRDIRKDAGLVYYVESYFEFGKTRGIYFVSYGCDPQNVSKVQGLVVRELREMQTIPVSADELQRAKAYLVHRIPLQEASLDAIARGIMHRWKLDLPFDEPTLAARRYLELGAPEVQAAFAKWLRPDDLVRVSLGPSSN
ncbi:MAG TPA: pitrilysin family protein [Burkholderiales bacterium]|nr:pitrilysin family protein [Burkholderiales bacterium]